MFLSLPVEVDCSDGAAVGITLKSNPPSAACTKKKYQKNNKLDQNGSNWIILDQIGSNWIKLDQKSKIQPTICCLYKKINTKKYW